MVLEIGSRLGVIICLLSLHIVLVAADVLFFKTKKARNSELDDTGSGTPNKIEIYDYLYPKGKDWLISLTEVRQCLAPLGTTLLGIVLIWATFSNANGIYRNVDSDCSTRLDADISGVGVRVSIWAQIGMLILISITGFFHQEDTGIKDIGGGLILTHFSLAIALIVQLCKRTLTSVDAAIGATILDAQNMALHIPLTAKQTLAARWQVILLVLAQILGLAFLPVLVVKLNRGDFASDGCKCLYIFWWSRLSDCGAFSSGELSIFWIYYSVRWMMWIQSCFHAMYNTQWFHMAEKNGRNPILDLEGIQKLRKATKSSPSMLERLAIKDRIPRLEQSMLKLEQQDPGRIIERATIQSGFLYKEYPATISMSYMTSALYSLTSMAVAEVTIHEFNLQASSGVYSVGQIIAIVVSGATILRAIWSFQSLFNDEENKAFPDLVFNLLWGPWKCCLCLCGEDDGNSNSGDDEKDQNRSSTESHHSDLQGNRLQTPPLFSQANTGSRLRPTQAGQAPFGRVQPNTNTAPTNNGSTEEPTASPPLEQSHSPSTIRRDRREKTRHQKRSHEPIYRFTFRQPFHLDAAKKIYFPTFSRYWQNRSKSKIAAVQMGNIDLSSQHRALVSMQDTECIRLEDSPVEHEYTPLVVIASHDESFVEPLAPGDKQQHPVSGEDSIPTDTSSSIKLHQRVPSSAVIQIPEEMPPEPAPSIAPALHKSEEDSVKTSTSVAGHISPLSGGGKVNPIQPDTNLDTGSSLGDDQPTGVLVSEQKQSRSIQSNTLTTSDLEEDCGNDSSPSLVLAMASSAVAQIPEDFPDDNSNPKTTQSDSPRGAEASSQRSREQDVASGLASTVVLSQAGDPVVAAQSLVPQIPSEFQPEHDRPETPLVLHVEEGLNDYFEVSGDHRSSVSSQKKDVPPGASVMDDLQSKTKKRKNRRTAKAAIGKSDDRTLVLFPSGASSWIMPAKHHYVGIPYFLGAIFANISDVKSGRVRNGPVRIVDVLDQSDAMRETISRELLKRSDVLLEKLPPGSAIHAAASRIRDRSEGSDIIDVVNNLDVSATTLRLPGQNFEEVVNQLGDLYLAGLWHETDGDFVYIVTGIANATNIDIRETVSHPPAISGPLDATMGDDASMRNDASIEAGDGKGKGIQVPSNPSGHRELIAYRLQKITVTNYRSNWQTT